MDIKEEQITYFKNESEKELNSKRNDYIQRVNDLGIKYQKIERRKGLTTLQRETELKTIDNEAKFYISEINKLTDKLYGANNGIRENIEAIATV